MSKARIRGTNHDTPWVHRTLRVYLSHFGVKNSPGVEGVPKVRIERGSVLQRKHEGLVECLLVVPTTATICLGGDGWKFNRNKDSGSLNQEMLGAKKHFPT